MLNIAMKTAFIFGKTGSIPQEYILNSSTDKNVIQTSHLNTLINHIKELIPSRVKDLPLTFVS